ncbi:MAG: cupredoxin domain-containing protein [Myxococcaceae bacterium]
MIRSAASANPLAADIGLVLRALTLLLCVCIGGACTREVAVSAPVQIPVAKPAEAPKAEQLLTLTVTAEGFVPTPAHVKAGVPLRLSVTRTSDDTCATELVLPEYKINAPLPLNQKVDITFTPEKTGTLTYGCAMDKMVAGVLVVQ